jgi:hypothetical protein
MSLGQGKSACRDIPIITGSDKARTLLVALVLLWGLDDELEVVHGGVKRHLSFDVLCVPLRQSRA